MNSTIGSWSAPETSSSNRGGWNADGSSKNGDGVLDDGTAIWGNPTSKKTGVDWAEKESLSNPPQSSSSNSEKRNHKPEPIISSINGTEAWGAPARSAPQLQSQQPLEPVAVAYSQAASAAPSRDLLKQMVHQIQLAVQAGHLDAHILNQQMSTPTLQLVYQLLQQIKKLHELQEIQQCAGMKSYVSSPTNIDMQINRIRQNISILQKAITQQQAAQTKNEAAVTGGDSSTVTGLANKPIAAPSNNFSSSSYASISHNRAWPSQSRISTNVSHDQQHRFSALDMMSDFGPSKIWRDGSAAEANTAPASSSSSFNSTTIGGLSMRSNPWMFAADSSSSLNMCSGLDSLSNKNGNNTSGNTIGNKLHNDNMDKMTAESLFLKSNNNPINAQPRSNNSALYDWSDLASSTMQLVNDNDLNKQNKPTNSPPTSALSGAAPGVGRPAPPPGLLGSNFGSLMGGVPSSSNGISILDSFTSGDDTPLQPRESSSSGLWSGAWLD